MSSDPPRAPEFRRNPELERLLDELNRLLAPVERGLTGDGVPREHPVILILGPPRSGTTLFLQWLAATGIAACPTNLLSRFYGAPVIGAKIQLLLTDERYNFRNEIRDFNSPIAYQSENGKTQGALAPNEFWYFWRRFLPPSRDDLDDRELRRVMDVETLRAELAGLTRVFEKPFAMKAMLFNANIPFLDSVLDKALFVQLRREPLANIHSLLGARRRQFGATEAWYSFRIREYGELKDLTPLEQCAGQVACADRAVTDGMKQLACNPGLSISYEEFCSDPARVYEAIAEALGDLGPAVSRRYEGPREFAASRDPVLSEKDRDSALAVYHRYFSRAYA